MKKTGPTKQSTRSLIVQLEKYGKKNKERIWLELAKRLAKPSRSRARVNIWKINKVAKKQKGKICVVPGVALSTGVLESKVGVAALRFSKQAAEKIKAQKGQMFSIKDLMDKKIKKRELVIVK